MRIGRPNFTHDYVPTQSVCFVAAAAIGAAGSLGGALISSRASGKAADAQAAAAANAIAAQNNMFRISQEQLQPFINIGKSKIDQLQSVTDKDFPLYQALFGGQTSAIHDLLKLTRPGANMTEALEQTPGFKFTSEYGQKAVRNALAARGLAGPGGALSRGIADYTTGLASNTWKDVVNALGGAIGTGTNTWRSGVDALQNIVGLGSNAAGNLATAAGNTGTGIANSMIQSGNAQASGILGSANALAGGLTGATNAFANQFMLQNLLKQGGGSSGGLYQTAAGPSSLTGWYNQ